MYPNHPVLYPTAPYFVGPYQVAPQDLQTIFGTSPPTFEATPKHTLSAEMSGSTLSCSANRPPSTTGTTAGGGQEIKGIAAAAVAVDTPPSSASIRHTDPPTPAKLAQLSGDQSSGTFGSDAKACSPKSFGGSFNSDPTDAVVATISPDRTPVDPSAIAPPCDPTASSSDSVSLESSLLLKPFSGMAGNTTKPDASMATPQSLQDVGSASISPLEMLIAALDPQKQQQQEDSIVAFPNADGSGGFGNGCCTGTANYAASMPWGNVDETATSACLQNAARRASDAVIFEGYQIGKPLSSNGSSGSDMVPQAEPLNRSMMLRKGSYPQQQGVKRPFSDFEHLLSAADLYANNQISGGAGNGFNAGSASAFSQAGADHSGPPAAKHTRHDSLIDNSSNMASVAESTAAAAAAASFSYAPMAFPYSTRRSTVLGNYFDQLSPTAANPLMSESMATGVVNGQPQPYLGRHNAAYQQQQQQQQQPQHYRSLSLSHIDYPNPHGMMAPPPPPPPPQYMASINMPHIPTSLQLASPLAPAPPPPASLSSSSVTAAAAAAAVAAGFGGGNPAMGYFYDGSMAMDGGLADGLGDATPGSIIFASAPIPAIPGVTVSPKEKPRRLSVPDLAPTRENDDGEEEEEEEGRGGPKARPRRQKVRFNDDMYTPMWVRGNGQQKEGFCDTCAAGKWLQLKNSAFWYHKQFFHGISSVSGRPFVRPLQVRHYDADIIEGLCHQCHQWVHIANAKRRNSVLWFRHAHKCHVYHKPKHDSNENKA